LDSDEDTLFFGIPTSTVTPLLIIANLLGYMAVVYCGWSGATKRLPLLLSAFKIACTVLEVLLTVTALGVAANFTFIVFGLTSGVGAPLGVCPIGPISDDECAPIVSFGIGGFMVLLSRVVILALALYWGVPLSKLVSTREQANLIQNRRT
jgi:hypothetical protein